MKILPQAEFLDRRAVLDPGTEEAAWIAAWRDTGSTAALTRLLQANSGRIRAMARAWSREGHRQDDLVSEGTLALIRCLAGYRVQPGVPFFAYARPFVRAAMRRCYFHDSVIVEVPLHHIRALRDGRGSDMDRALLRGASRPDAMDTADTLSLGTDDETGEAALIRGESDLTRRQVLDAVVATLSEVERLLIDRRRADADLSLADLAAQLGLSPEQARKVESRALSRLKAQLSLRGITSARAAAAE